MKFAIRKLAVTCILPAALFEGALSAEAWAQVPPPAVTQPNTAQPASRLVPSRVKPAVATAPAGPQRGGSIRQVNQVRNPGTFSQAGQAANPAYPPNMPPQVAQNSETDVQRQLRMLYEKSGQQMPAMTLDELEVPEPQGGVQPNGGGAAEGGDEMEGEPQYAQPQYAQPPAPPQKAPNFFERVFLGKKAPQQQPQRQMPQRPQPYGTGQVRPGQPNGVSASAPGSQPRPNYRPYQQPSAPANGQRPAATIPQTQAMPPQGGYAQPSQPNSPVQQQQAQPQMQQPQYQQPQYQQPQQQLQQPQLQRPPVQPPPAPQTQNAPGAAAGFSQGNPQQSQALTPPVVDDVPLLEEEPEESMELDLGPTTPPTIKPNATSAPAATAENSSPADELEAPSTTDAPSDSAPAESTEAAVEENPFSGLRLNVPESATPSATTNTTPRASTSKSAAANATLPRNAPSGTSARTKSETSHRTKSENPFLDAPAATQAKEVPKATPQAAPAAASKTQLAPGKASRPPQPIKPAVIANGKPAQEPTSIKNEPSLDLDVNLKKLAAATQKEGFKGFCPVVLRQERQLIESKVQFNSTFAGKKYHFSTSAAKATFEKSPKQFVPTHSGNDAVALLDDEETTPGTLDFAAWYQGRLYLFANQQNLEMFKADPEQYQDDEDDSESPTKLTSGTTENKLVAPAVRLPAKTTNAGPSQPAPAKTRDAFDDIPMLSENLDDVKPIAPPAAAPTAKKDAPAAKTNAPKLIQPSTGIRGAGSSTKDSSKNEAPKALAPKAPSERVQKIDSKVAIEAPGTSATSLVSNPPKTPAAKVVQPPRLIRPELRLAPAAAMPTK